MVIRWLIVAMLFGRAEAGVIAVSPDGQAIRPGEICAATEKQMELTARLRLLAEQFRSGAATGFVNQTRGSYFEIDLGGDQIAMTFYTSGPFDFFLIRRADMVQFCDDGSRLAVKGFKRVEEVKLEGAVLILGKGGPRQSFAVGEMPALLKKLSGRK